MAYYQEFPDFREDIEKIFNYDIRDKKQTGSGIHGRAARLRKHEAVVMPSERLTKFERKVITGAGVCKSYNLWEAKKVDILGRIRAGEIPQQTEIEELGFNKAQECFAELRRLNTNAKIQSVWEIGDNLKFSKYMMKFSVAKTKSGQVLIGSAADEYYGQQKSLDRSRAKKEGKDSAPVIQKVEEPVIDTQIQPTIYNANSTPYYNVSYTNPVPVVQPWVEEDRNIISINRKYTHEQLTKYLERLTFYLDPDSDFEVEIKIKEVTEAKNE